MEDLAAAGTDVPGIPPPDLRLVPGALAAWATVLAGLAAGWLPAAALTVAAGVLAAVAAGTRRRRSPRGLRAPAEGVGALHVGVLTTRRRGRAAVFARVLTPRTGAGVLAAAACAAAAGLVVTTHGLLAAVHPLVPAAERGAAATLRVVVADDPQPLRDGGYGARAGSATRVLVRASLRAAVTGDGQWRAGGRVLLLAPADGWTGLLPGQEVTAEGLLAPAARADLTVAVLRVRGEPLQVTAPPWWQTGAGALRDGLRRAAEVLPQAEAGLLPGLAVGDTSRSVPEVERDFRTAGLTHLTAVSGANIAILAGAVLGLLRLLRTDPRWAAAAGALAVAGFVLLARPSPSVVRAAAMGAVVLLALALGRRRSAVPALAAAVLALLLIDPALAVDPGFALSVLATGALVLVAPRWVAALRARGVPAGIAEAVVVPTAAHLATAPVIAGLSGEVGLVTVVANLLAAPAVAPATVLGVLAAVLSPLGEIPARMCAWLAGPAVTWLVAVADRAAAVPGATLPWPGGIGGGLLLAAAVVLLLLFGRDPRRRALLLAVAVGLALVLVPTRVVPPGWPPPGWAVVACDVGQGDALVLATGRPGWVVLVDTGPDPGPVDACLDRLDVEGLALVVLSHLHADHVGGLAGALRERAVAGVAIGPAREPRWALREVARHAAVAGAPLVELSAARRLVWPALTVDVLGPRHVPDLVDPDDGTAVNDTSLVLRAETPAGSVLLTGDVELAAQADLLDARTALRADVLKMPHHGSRYTSSEFLAAVAPRAVLVSVGAGNRYRHPDMRLLDALGRAGAVVRRTDQAGDIALAVGDDGQGALVVVARGDPLPAPRRRSASGPAAAVRGSPGRGGGAVAGARARARWRSGARLAAAAGPIAGARARARRRCGARLVAAAGPIAGARARARRRCAGRGSRRGRTSWGRRSRGRCFAPQTLGRPRRPRGGVVAMRAPRRGAHASQGPCAPRRGCAPVAEAAASARRVDPLRGRVWGRGGARARPRAARGCPARAARRVAVRAAALRRGVAAQSAQTAGTRRRPLARLAGPAAPARRVGCLRGGARRGGAQRWAERGTGPHGASR
ncbi:ComEC/Rec2 family competence protein [Pseudonocardia sp.]|uniref:ComEC/Rec2 family competence protein n=1 Tax=Pseudonocardia sp. TaxID=60912 RepID=UPI003D0D1434